MDTLFKEETTSPPKKCYARPINRMGDSPHAVSNQRNGSRFPARSLNQPRVFKPLASEEEAFYYTGRDSSVGRPRGTVGKVFSSDISRIYKGAIATFLPIPDKEEEELEIVQYQRSIKLRTTLFKFPQ